MADSIIDNFELIFGIVYIFIIFITYSFQYSNIIINKNVEGITNSFMILGNISSITSLMNALIFYFYIVKDCNIREIIECINKSLGLYQISTQFICYNILYCLYIYYVGNLKIIQDQLNDFIYDNNHIYTSHQFTSTIQNTNYSNNFIQVTTYKYKICFIFSLFFNFSLIAVTIGLISINDWTGYDLPEVIIYAEVLGYLCAFFVIMQYIPLIYQLYKNKRPGILSPVTYIFLSIGNIISFIFLFSQQNSHFTTWLPYIICFSLQFTIYLQIIYYKYKNKRELINALNERINYRSFNNDI